jgi:cation transport protein ChaC
LTEDLWVFGYGSLMWRPGFPHLEAWPAVLPGYHRSFCVYSTHWRGTPARPGLVLGLTPGGQCRGVAFRVEASQRHRVVDYLNERELGSYAYVADTMPVSIGGSSVPCYTFIADQSHHYYAGDLPLGDAARIIMEAEGKAGLNRDYLINTLRELDRHGYGEPSLQELLHEIERRTGIIEQGSGI